MCTTHETLSSLVENCKIVFSRDRPVSLSGVGPNGTAAYWLKESCPSMVRNYAVTYKQREVEKKRGTKMDFLET